MIVVSICIPTYNQVKSLKRCLDSILMQTYNLFEIIITDDSDSNIVEDFLRKYDFKKIPFRYLKNTEQLGSPQNWNKCIQLASGKYIKVLHHDDWFTYSNSLQIFVDTLENNCEASIGFVSSRNVDIENNEIININTPTKEYINLIQFKPNLLICGNQIGSPSATIFRKYEIQYFDENLKWFVDIEAYTRILTNYNKTLSFNSSDAISIGISQYQISRECENNLKMINFEFFYFLNKHYKSKLLDRNIFSATIRLINNSNFQSLDDVKYYFHKQLPPFLKIVFLLKFILGKRLSNRIFFSKFFKGSLY